MFLPPYRRGGKEQLTSKVEHWIIDTCCHTLDEILSGFRKARPTFVRKVLSEGFELIVHDILSGKGKFVFVRILEREADRLR